MTDPRSTSAADNAIINLVDRLLAKAIEDRAAYLYFEPQPKSLQIDIRKDGMLQTALQHLPHKLLAPTIAYLKTMARIGADLPAPQTGTIDLDSKFGRIKVEIMTLPTHFGDRVTAKIAYIEQPPLSLSRLIPDREIIEPLQQLIHSDRGLIAIVGGHDSGKSTTIYASLAELNRSNRSIYAIDRELKYTVPGIAQISLPNDATDETIARTIHTCLRQQPDILAIGCIDSLPVALAALQAVASGCLVFATINAATAGGAISSLIDLGVSATQIYAATLGIVAQKSIAKICYQCRLPHQPGNLELAQLGSTMLRLTEQPYYRAHTLNLAAIEQARQSGELCPQCQGLGYRGRIGLQEVVVITDRLKSAILSGDAERIDLAAQETGMRSFMDLAVKLFREGYTTLAEMRRCVAPRTLLQHQLANAETYPDRAVDGDNVESLEAALHWKQQANKTQTDYEQLLLELKHCQQESAQFEQRIKQSRTHAEQGTRAEIALHLLSVVDAIELARISIKPQTDREAAIQKGYAMLENKMLSSIKEIGVRITECKGHKFDPHLHEVVQEIGTHDYPPGLIIDEFKRGYTLGDRVLRLAQVKVAVASIFA